MYRWENIPFVGMVRCESWYSSRKEAVEDAKAMGFSLDEVEITKIG